MDVMTNFSVGTVDEEVWRRTEPGATHISPIVLHLRPGVKEWFLSWLQMEHPELAASYEAIYKRADAPKEVTETIRKTVGGFKRKYVAAAVPSARYSSARVREVSDKPKPKRSEQMSFELGEDAPRKAPSWVKLNSGAA